MRAILLNLFFIFSYPLHAGANVGPNYQNSCPTEVVISVECPANPKKDFQLLQHVGRYSQPKAEFDRTQGLMVCTYSSEKWGSVYQITDADGPRAVRVSSLQDLFDHNVFAALQSKGFKIAGSADVAEPFSIVTYTQKDQVLTTNQMFLFSGLESTLGKENMTVSADRNDVSTVVINERYMKSKEAADIFETGSNCLVTIK